MSKTLSCQANGQMHAHANPFGVPRSALRRFLRRSVVRIALMLFVFWNILEVLLIHYRLTTSEADERWPALPPLLRNEKIFIASIHRNSEKILPDWNEAIVSLAKTIGPENVFVSVYENGSWDKTQSMLKDLDKQLEALSVGRNITLDSQSRAKLLAGPPKERESGWVKTPQGRTELRRIPYLAKLRNFSIAPLYELKKQGMRFDKILFLNDVIFTTKDILSLIQTVSGDCSAACSMDYSRPPDFYDTFALRDSSGQEALMQKWPYFRSRQSRSAMKANAPVPVESCWNGAVVMLAAPFTARLNKLQFRGLHDRLAAKHVEASESCLIHADNPMPGRVFVNPRVRVAYSREAYDEIHGDAWTSPWRIFLGLWENRILRWTTTSWFKERIIKHRIRLWEAEEGDGTREYGGFCAIDEMQVLRATDWAHV